MRFQSALAAASVVLVGSLPPPTAHGAAAKKPAAKVSAKAGAKASVKGPTERKAPESTLSNAQLAMATQVQTGRADCEFNEYVLVHPHVSQAGTFSVKFRTTTYTMVPEETSTGAVRLYDKKAGVIWLQIPVKSMLMDNRAGRRLIDACTQPGQRMALAEAEAKAKATADAAVAAAAAAAAAEAIAAAAPASAAAAAAAADAPLVITPASVPGAVLPAYADPAASAPFAVEPASAPASGVPASKRFWQR